MMNRKWVALALSFLLGLLSTMPWRAVAQSPAVPLINSANWGTVTTPVFNTSETSANGIYASAELFAGPQKFDNNYYHGVLPNGRIVNPAGKSIQIGMNPLGVVLTPDGNYLITSNDDERNVDSTSLQSQVNVGGYSLSVIDAKTMQVVSQISNKSKGFIGLQVTSNASGSYIVWASGGGDNKIYLFNVSTSGVISAASPVSSIMINPILPSDQGYVSNYTPSNAFTSTTPVPSGFDTKNGAKITFPAGSALSPDGKYFYVACNGDNSLAIIDTTSFKVVKQLPVGYFPYGVSVSNDGGTVLVANWGITEYKFSNPTYSGDTLTAIATTGQNQPSGYFVPKTSTSGSNPQTSSISVIKVPKGDVTNATLAGSYYEGKQLDALYSVGDTHPSATAIVKQGATEVLYVAKANDDSLGMIQLGSKIKQLRDFNLSSLRAIAYDRHKVSGAYPNAIVASPDSKRLYVAEAGINSVAVLDTTSPLRPKLLGRIPTGWYPTALAISPDGQTLYIANAKGIGEDINPNTINNATATGVESFSDSNYIFGSLQQVSLQESIDNNTALGYNFAVNPPPDTSVVPVGGKASSKIRHVFFILHENKSFDSMLGNRSDKFDNFASLTYNKQDGTSYTDIQNTGVDLNTQMLGTTFATAVNYYSDAEESDAGHQFSASGTATDYTEKTLLVKTGRGLLVNKNFEPEDYPASGYVFNNAARNNVSFKDYGAMIRIEGTDTGTSTPTTLDDPSSGNVGYPQINGSSISNLLVNLGDVDSPVSGLGQSYFLNLPILAVLGQNNANGEAHLDRNYPGYNFNISDQRRAQEFIQDFDRMVQSNTLPQFLYIYQPNDHTGSVQAPNKANVGTSALQQIADGDVALGMVVSHIMNSKTYYDPSTGEGSAIFITYDDAQSSLDHIHPHRTPLLAISPYAKPGYVAKKHYVTASIVKTEELLLGLPPNNLGDLFATDLRDMFQSTYNNITASSLTFNRLASYTPSSEGKRLWALVDHLNTSAPDRDSLRLGRLTRLSAKADELHKAAAKKQELTSASYKAKQEQLYQLALKLVNSTAPRDSDG